MVPFVASAYSGKGWPDTHVTAHGMDCWVEWKDVGKKGKDYALQLHRCRQIRKAGGCAFITDWPEAAVKAIQLWVSDGVLPPIELRRPK